MDCCWAVGKAQQKANSKVDCSDAQWVAKWALRMAEHWEAMRVDEMAVMTDILQAVHLDVHWIDWKDAKRGLTKAAWTDT
jgi:hypothetical protein